MLSPRARVPSRHNDVVLVPARIWWLLVMNLEKVLGRPEVSGPTDPGPVEKNIKMYMIINCLIILKYYTQQTGQHWRMWGGGGWGLYSSVQNVKWGCAADMGVGFTTILVHSCILALFSKKLMLAILV